MATGHLGTSLSDGAEAKGLPTFNRVFGALYIANVILTGIAFLLMFTIGAGLACAFQKWDCFDLVDNL
ncbi:MAG: hypothetical protein V3V96_16210 [Acidiferrobacterales bacterium]